MQELASHQPARSTRGEKPPIAAMEETSYKAAMPYVYLSIAIIMEIVATSALKASDGFTKLEPTIISVIGYVIAFYCLSMTLRTMPVGIAYAIWSGVGIAALALIGWLVFRQPIDTAGMIGLTLIIAGVIVLNVFSKTSAH